MTLADIAAELPSGFHDAFLRTLTIDYVSRRATLDLRVSVGDPDAPTKAEREAYEPVTVTISGLLWYVVEPPIPSTERTDKGLWIDAGPVSDLKDQPVLPSVPDGAFVWWIFVRQWNAFMYVAAREASMDRRGS
jgi:hypothetical protein